jgi:glycosyltransferase involved in cell wall biosynthesis
MVYGGGTFYYISSFMSGEVMKVLLISAYFPIKQDDPTRSFVRDEASALSKAGVEVHVARWRYAGRFFHTKDSVVDGIYVHGLKLFSPKNLFIGFSNLWELPISLFPLKELGRTGVFFSYGKQVEKIVKRCSIDFIHAHFAHPDGLVASVAKNCTGKPLVISVWGYDVQSDPKIGYGSLSRRDTTYLVKRALMAADAIIVGAESHHKMVTRLIGEERSDKVHFISPGIDTIRFNPNVDGSKVRKKLGIRADQPVVLLARHLMPIYGTEHLIKTVPYVIKKCPDAVFLILGEGPLLADLRELANNLNVADQTKFLGQVPKTEMPLYYATSDVFADPCLVGQGYSTLEAMACGTPAVGFKTGQIKIKDNINGFLVKPYNREALAGKIIQLLDDSELRRKMGEKGRKHVIKHCSIDTRVKKLIDIYYGLKNVHVG